MSASSPATSLHKWLKNATDLLQDAGVTSARLDAMLLLADTLQKEKAWLLAHPELELTPAQLTKANESLQKRRQRMPMAYIRGYQEFYGRDFAVNSHVLIPRPETEVLIAQLLTLPRTPNSTLIDVGTGSGAIAITAKLERPGLQVIASDISTDALQVALQNADALHAEVRFESRDLLQGFPNNSASYILANLPYVAPTWAHSPETDFEPELALFAEDEGLALITELLTQAVTILKPQGWLLLEADPRQHKRIAQFAKHHGYSVAASQGFAITLQRT